MGRHAQRTTRFDSTTSQSMASAMVHGVSELLIMDRRLIVRMMAAASVIVPIPNHAIRAALCFVDICRPRTVGIGLMMSRKSVTPPVTAWRMYQGGRGMQLSPVYSRRFHAAEMGRQAKRTAKKTDPKQTRQRKPVNMMLY